MKKVGMLVLVIATFVAMTIPYRPAAAASTDNESYCNKLAKDHVMFCVVSGGDPVECALEGGDVKCLCMGNVPTPDHDCIIIVR